MTTRFVAALNREAERPKQYRQRRKIAADRTWSTRGGSFTASSSGIRGWAVFSA